MTTWFSTTDDPAEERLLGAWPDAPTDRLEVCGMLLEVAKEQVIAYARHTDLYDVEGDPVTDIPDRLVLAQLQQATNLWNAGRVSSSGDVGMDGFTYTPRPLDKTIRGMIRPVDGSPHVL